MSDKPDPKIPMAESRARGRARPCPVCGQAAMAAQHPFCSQRCRDVDLGRWLKGAYAIPGRAPGLGEDDDDEY
ncbi:MAG: DNA gyrase inhibitor YacG [Alphaproteobacteria bacterium]|nr:DNA gyrase inhibitor YacG [Alphaproteobacteria bacterium]